MPRNGFQTAYDPNIDPVGNAAVTLVCPNVNSFQVRIRKDSANASTTLAFEDLPKRNAGTAPPAFDTTLRPTRNPTAATAVSTTDYRILGVQIILRVYDGASGLSREVTLIQDL